MMEFKTQYINYAMGGNSVLPGDKTSYTFRNFRDCAYAITIRKFSPRWELLHSWGYYGIPEVNIQESGSSSPTVEFSEINFSIVGEFEPRLVLTESKTLLSELESSGLAKMANITTIKPTTHFDPAIRGH